MRHLMEINLPTIAGFISTGLFTVGTLPMLTKAFRTKDLASYSLGNIVLSNVGNLIYSIYVFQLPPGPIWFLQSFNLISTGLMLIWYLKYEGLPIRLRSSIDKATTRFPSPLCCNPAM
jgi:uncharacterized protein with PQ loop repeat